jgi:hypothetical protein
MLSLHHASAVLFLVSGLAMTDPSWARYSAQVEQVPNLASGVRRVALMPMTCPPGIDCLRVETRLAGALRGFKGFVVTDVEQVRQALFELGTSQVTPENVGLVARKLGVDALSFGKVGSAGSATSGSVGFMAGSSFVVVREEVKHSGVEDRWIGPSWTTLLQGIEAGTCSARI